MEIKRCVNCMEEITNSVCPHCGYKEGETEQASYGLKRNSILHGRYLVGNVLGQGGFGITYIGFDIALEIKVAIKEYFPMGYVSRDYTHSNQIVWNIMRDGQEQWKKGSESFLKEARRMAKIDVFPEIVRVRDTFMENNTSYIVMDYVEGETLKAWLLKNGTMKFSDCVKMLSPLMQSLNRVHKRGLIHRDISPDNIMLLPDGEVRLLDLGAAKDLSIESNGTSQLVTKKGFSPSEQYMENGSIGTWTDVYALSATIYYSITGKPVPEALDRLMGDTLKFDVPLKEALSEKAVETLKAGLAIKAEDRIQTVEELEQRLQKAIQLGKEPEPKKEPEEEPKPKKEPEKKAEPAPDTIPEQKASIETDQKEIMAAAMNGDSDAQFRLGCLYYAGKDYNNARQMFLELAEKGNSKAQNSLGILYEDSLNVETAMEWYKKAADNGNKDGTANYNRLASRYRKTTQPEEEPESASNIIPEQKASIETDQKEIMAAAMNGDSDAQFRLGCLYYADKDYNNARQMFLQSAEKGNSKAQNGLGILYEDSMNVEIAMEWYKKAADNGNKDGAANYERLQSRYGKLS